MCTPSPWFAYILAGALALGFAFTAGADLATCQADDSNNPAKCSTQAATANTDATNAANAAKVALANNGMSNPASSISDLSSQAAGEQAAALENCNQLKTQCDKDCQAVTDPQSKQAAQTAQKDCDTKIQTAVQSLGKSIAGLTQNAGDQANTGNQSSGMPMMMPPSPSPSPSPDPSPTPSSTPAAASATPNCSGSESATSSDCTTQLVAQCSSDPQSGSCPQFSQAYCSSSGGSSDNSSSDSSGNSFNPGQGLTDNPSYCKSYLNQSTGYPNFADPNTAQTMQEATNPSAKGGGGGGSSGGSSIPSGAATAAVPTVGARATSEQISGNAQLLKHMSMDTDSAGGGGGASSTTSGLDVNSALDTLTHSISTPEQRKLASLSSGEQIAGLASDVQSSKGPSLFSISSQVLRIHCQHGALMHCGPGIK